MTQRIDWDLAYRQDQAPAWNIGEPQPALAALLDVDGAVRDDVLDAGCGHAELSLELAARGHTVVGIDLSPTAIAAATAAAKERGLDTATFAQADVSSFAEYPAGSEGRFSTIFDSGLLHALPADLRDSYLRSLHRAAAPGASFYILAFGVGAFEGHVGPGPTQFSENELRTVVSAVWQVEQIRPAILYSNPTQLPGGPESSAAQTDVQGRSGLPGFLVIAKKEQ